MPGNSGQLRPQVFVAAPATVQDARSRNWRAAGRIGIRFLRDDGAIGWRLANRRRMQATDTLRLVLTALQARNSTPTTTARAIQLSAGYS